MTPDPSQGAVAIIPARGGSKRIERKNVVPFRGRPLIAWTIEAALAAGAFAEVVVSTDDEEIAEVSRRHGASVPFLRERHADDAAPVSLATIEALRQLREAGGPEYRTVVQLMANCPLRTAEHVRQALRHFGEQGAKAQVSCFRFGWMNPWWAATLSDDLRPRSLFPEAARTRSQDLPPLYCPTGAVWVAEVAHLIEHGTFHTPERIYWPMPWQAAVDIDDHDDLRMAEVLFDLERRPS